MDSSVGLLPMHCNIALNPSRMTTPSVQFSENNASNPEKEDYQLPRCVCAKLGFQH